MAFLIDVNKLEKTEGFFGGNAGLKDARLIDGKRWIIKFPQDLTLMKRVTIPYSTGPLSEYLGSQIYKILGFDVHETKLGFAKNEITGQVQLVVCCKDFTDNGKKEIVDYEKIKNKHSDKLAAELENCRKKINNEEEPLFMDHHTNIEEILVQLKNNDFLKKYPEIKKHFWKMLVVDFLINNNDRNRSNWGFLYDKESDKYTIAPVFDNGACFKTKDSDEKMQKVLADNNKFEIAAGNGMSHFVFNNHHCNFLTLFDWLEKTKNDQGLKEAIVELVPEIGKNMQKIKDQINNLPEEENGVKIISKTQKKYYTKHLDFIYQKKLVPLYQKYQKNNEKNM